MMMSCDDVSSSGGRASRVEVFTGTRRRRPWSDDEKARIVAESYAGDGSTVCDVARRNDICPSQLFTWRRQFRQPVETAEAPMFVPAVIEEAATPAAAAPPPASVSASRPPRRPRRTRRSAGAAPIEVSMDGISVRIGRGADATLIAAVLDALKGSR
jgi:transposase